MSVSFIVPTIGRPTLARALESIRGQLQAGDEVIVGTQRQDVEVPDWCRLVQVPSCPMRAWGGPERRAAMAVATGTHLAFLDDDDIYLPGARAAMADAPPDQPTVFRMQFAATGAVLWAQPVLEKCNVGSPMFLVPNDPSMWGDWRDRRTGDFYFLATSRWPVLTWRPEVIALIRPEGVPC